MKLKIEYWSTFLVLDVMYFKILQFLIRTDFPGEIYSILSFWFTRNVLAFNHESSTKFCISTIYANLPRRYSAPLSCSFQ